MYEEKSGVNEAVVEENLVQAADEQGRRCSNYCRPHG